MFRVLHVVLFAVTSQLLTAKFIEYRREKTSVSTCDGTTSTVRGEGECSLLCNIEPRCLAYLYGVNRQCHLCRDVPDLPETCGGDNILAQKVHCMAYNSHIFKRQTMFSF